MRPATDLVSVRLAICYVLADLEAANGIQIREEIEELADEEMSNQRVYEVLYSMMDAGLVSQEKRNATRGRYKLTDEGRAQLEEHHEWATLRLDEDSGQQTF